MTFIRSSCNRIVVPVSNIDYFSAEPDGHYIAHMRDSSNCADLRVSSDQVDALHATYLPALTGQRVFIVGYDDEKDQMIHIESVALAWRLLGEEIYPVCPDGPFDESHNHSWDWDWLLENLSGQVLRSDGACYNSLDEAKADMLETRRMMKCGDHFGASRK